MPRGTAKETRNRILKAADRLFYHRGINQVSVDQIADVAGVTKKTIYYHYPTKDELVVAYLERRDETTLRWLISTAEAGGDDPCDQMRALFAGLAEWSGTDAFAGCPFLRVTGDLAGNAGHPALAISAAHKQKHLDWFTALAKQTGAANPQRLGRQLLLLVDGAIAETLITDNPDYFRDAGVAAVQLIGSQQ